MSDLPAETAEAYAPGRQQRRLWAAGHRDPAPRITVRVAAAADSAPETIASRLAAVVATHEALRTVVLVPAGLVDPVQLVSDDPVVTATLGDGVLELSGDPLVTDATTLLQAAGVLLGTSADAEDPIQFAEYAQWQSELGEQPPDGAAEFWAALGDLTWTPVPRAHLVAGAAGADVGVTPAIGWPGLLAAALAVLSGEETLTFGVEVDARRGDELVGAAGPYSEVLPLRVDVLPDDTLADLAHRCDARLAELERHHEWAPDPTPSDAAVLLGRGPADATIPRPGASAELRVAADASARLLDHDPAAGGLAGLAAGLGALRDLDPATPIGDIDIVAAAGLAVADAAAAAAPAASVLDAVFAWAQRTPDRVAVRASGGAQLTYAELAGTIGELAGRLGVPGTGAGPVAVAADRSVGAVVALLGAMLSGRGYLPLDPTQPATRLAAALDECGCDLLLADADADLGSVAELDHDRLRVERVGPPWEAGASDAPRPPAPQSPAYTIFTSGSTGTPKGVGISLANLDSYVAGVRARLGLADGWNWALATLVSTDLGNTALFGSLVGGGTLTVLDDNEVLDAAAFAAALTEGRVDALKITPTHLSGLLAGEASPLPRELVLLGGEALPWTLVDRVRSLSDVRIANHYGPTETTVGALAHEVTGHEPRSAAGVPIGRPLPGVRAAAFTPRGARVAVGAAGELYLGGAGLAAGYRGDAARTAERFVTLGGGERMYRTGDIVRFRADGEVEFLGRRDGQVKIRGYRVETGEIEAALLAHPGVQRVAVVARADESGTRLAAYLVSHYHPSPTPADLDAHLAARLPAHMVPSWFVEVERLPMTGNGKLDVRALPEPSGETTETAGYAPPETLVETEIAAIYADLLGHERVGRLDDFFRLGGHSLLAAQVVMRIRRGLAVELPIQSIFVHPTVLALAAEIEAMLLADVDDPPGDDVL